MLTVVPGPASGDDDRPPASGSTSLIDQIVREGARRMLAEALQAEVDAYIAAYAASATSTATAWWCATVTTKRARC
jgi:hypothetical protein